MHAVPVLLAAALVTPRVKEIAGPTKNDKLTATALCPVKTATCRGNTKINPESTIAADDCQNVAL